MNKRLLFKRIHLVCAFLSAIPIMAAGLTGTILVFYKPADYLVNRPHADTVPGTARFSLQELTEKVSQLYPEMRWTGINIPHRADRAVQLWARNDRNESWVVYVDPYRAQVTSAYPSDAFSRQTVIRWLTSFHYSLRAGQVGARIVGISTILLVISTLTGLILWTPKTVQSLVWRLKPRLAKSWKQNAYNWHAFLGFYSSIGLLVVAGSGMTMAFHKQIDPFIFWVTQTKAPTETDEIPAAPEKPFLNPDQIVGVASNFLQTHYTGKLWPEYVSLPSQKDARSFVYFQESDDLYDLTLYEVVVNAQDGTILESSAPSSRNNGERIRDWIAVLHFGTWGDVGGPFLGWAVRLLWIGIALMPPFLFASGFIIWVRRGRTSQRRELKLPTPRFAERS